jgi:hypothetical protein
MSGLDQYQSALLAVYPEVSEEALNHAVDSGGAKFVSFVIAHGLGPQWHLRAERPEFHESRLAAEALYLAQEHALKDIDAALEGAGVEFALIKGAANRLLLYENPAIRACHDLDLLVRPEDRVRAATAIVEAGFTANPEAGSISRELVLTRGDICVDLHWALLREGRLRRDPTSEILSRRRRSGELWMLNAEDALFVLLVHPAFTKHLAGWDMGLHRVMDIVEWLRTQDFDWQTVRAELQRNGVQTAAWATLKWMELLSTPQTLPRLDEMLSDVRPGRLRSAWLNAWLRKDLPARTSRMHWARLIGFTMFLHDTAGDSVRAFAGRYRASRRSRADLAVFEALSDQ